LKTYFLKLACGLVLLGAVAAVSAQSTFTSVETGLLSGSLGGTAFSDAVVTLTTVANTADISYYAGQYPSYFVNGTTTIQIQGFSLATFTTAGTNSFGIFSQNLNRAYSGKGVVGMAENFGNSTFMGILANFDTSPNYDFLTAATFTGTALIGSGGFSTDQGTLVVISTSGNATFTTEPAPEPSTPALAGLGGLSLLLFRRRK
jgi:hypothetical protein